MTAAGGVRMTAELSVRPFAPDWDDCRYPPPAADATTHDKVNEMAETQLAAVFVEMADTLVDDFDLIDFLHHLTEHAAAASGASSVGLMLGDTHDRLTFMAATSTGAEHMELFQLQTDEGPCLDCYRTRKPVTVVDLASAVQRWPRFAPAAVDAGFRSVHAFPLRLRDRPVGALNVFGEDVMALADEEVRAIQALADVATIALLQERALTAAEVLTQQLQGALNSRILIEQAKGVVAQSNGVSVLVAFDQMRGHARAHHIRLTDLAVAIVNREVDPADFVR
jgi:GAF domain-containing protein